MLRLPPFDYIAPRSVDEAVDTLSDCGPEAMIVAGGTDLYPNMKRRQFEPRVLVGLRDLPELRGLRGDVNSGVVIGAGMTLTQLSSHPAIQHHYPALARAAGLVSTPQLRNVGTIGGNLCVDTRCNYYNQSYHWRKSIGFCMKKDGNICLVAPGSPRCWAVSSSDTAPVMVTLGARVRLVGPNGEREIPVQALYQDDGIAYLTKGPHEILTEILIPPADGLKSTYWKLRRRGSFDFPVLGVAVALRQDDDGTVTDARIALGAVRSCPIEAKEAEQMLVGQKLTPDVIDRAAQLAYRLAKPLDNTDLPHFWRKRMARVYVARALRELAGVTRDA